jgi:hypothetical protein
MGPGEYLVWKLERKASHMFTDDDCLLFFLLVILLVGSKIRRIMRSLLFLEKHINLEEDRI